MILALCFVGAAVFFIGSYDRYRKARIEFTALTKKAKTLAHQEREAERKNRTLLEVERFLRDAKALGLEKERWTYYDVNLQEPVSFAKMERILNQCNNSDAAYYKPISLHIKRTAAAPATTADQASSRSADSGAGAPNGLSITLSGKFIARPE